MEPPAVESRGNASDDGTSGSASAPIILTSPQKKRMEAPIIFTSPQKKRMEANRQEANAKWAPG